MKNRIIALVVGIGVLVCSPLSAQAPDTLWTRTYGGIQLDWGWSVQETSDSGYIIAGYTMSFGAGVEDVYLIKTNTIGDTLWTKTYGGTLPDLSQSVQQTTDGGYIIAGYTMSFGIGGFDVYLIKTDENGSILWTNTYGGTSHDLGVFVQETSDSGYIIAGSTNSFGAIYEDVYLIKTNTIGDTLWTKTYGGSSGDWGMSVQETSDGGFIVIGYTNSFGAAWYDVYLIKTNIYGDTLWTKMYGGYGYDRGNSVQETSDGGYIIAGVWSYDTGGDIYLIKTDPSGNTLWTKTYGGSEAEEAFSVQKTSDGGYIIAGWTSTFGAGEYDVYLLKTDSLGDSIWTKTCGGIDWDKGCLVQQTFDGGYIIVGYTSSFGAGSRDVYLIKTEPDPASVNEKPEQKPTSKDLRFIISPNPSTTATWLRISDCQNIRESELHIYDTSGRLVKSVKLETNTYQLGADLVPGIYFLKLNGTPVGKVVKVR